MSLQIRLMHTDEFPRVVEIAEETYPRGYFVQEPNEIILVAFQAGEIVGFVCGGPLAPDINLRSLCVTRCAQHQGVGLALGRNFIERAGALPLRSPAWIRRNGEAPSGPLLQKLGLRPAEKIANYWRQAAVDRKLTCPDCGPPACHCVAQIYRSSRAAA